MSKMVSMGGCKKRLASVWLIGSGLLLALVLAQTLLGRFESAWSDAWGWALPLFLPTLTLIIGVFVSDASAPQTDKKIDSYYFTLAFALSAAYFAVVLLTLMTMPLVINDQLPPVAYLKSTHLWLSPIQGLATAMLGAFFAKAAAAK